MLNTHISRILEDLLGASKLRSLRIRVAGWRLVSSIALLLTLMAVFWHRQVIPPPTPQVVPPYAAPAVEQSMLRAEDLPDDNGTGWLVTQNGPPETSLFFGTGRLRADMRRLLLLGGWQRTWTSDDGTDMVQVRLMEARRNEYAQLSNIADCEPRTVLYIPGADAAGYTTRRSDYAVACAQAVRGRTALVVNVRSAGPDAPKAARRELSDVVRRQLPRIPELPDRPRIALKDTSGHIAANSLAMTIGLGIPLLLGLANLVRDRSSWRRLRSRFTRSDHSGVFWVDPVVARRLAAGLAAVLLRLCVYAWAIRLCEIYGRGIRGTMGTYLAAMAGVLVVEWLVRRRRPARWRPPMFDGKWRLLALAGGMTTVAIASVGVFLLLFAASLETLGVNVDGGSDHVARRIGLVLFVVGVVVMLMSLLPFTLVRRLGMRRLRDHNERDDRRPTLMLRSFADDRRTLRARRLDRASVLERLFMRRFERFEEVAAAALAAHGPVVALSQVGEKMPPPLGAVRRSFSMNDWKDRVGELIARSQLICVTVGRSESLLWEIRQIRAAGALERTLFLLPPTGRLEQRRRLAVLGHALGIDWQDLDWSRPGVEVLAVTYCVGHPVVIAGRTPDDVGYEAVVEIAASALLGKAEEANPDIRPAISAYVAHAAGSGSTDTSSSRRCEGRKQSAAPQVQIFGPGAAPVYRPWWGDWWGALRWRYRVQVLGAIVIIPLTFIVGHSVSDMDVLSVRGPATALVEDRMSSKAYAVVAGHHLLFLDFRHSKVHLVASVPDTIDALVVRGSDVYYASTVHGRVGHVDLHDGAITWTHPVPGVRSLALTGDGASLITASPIREQVETLATTDGHSVAKRPLAGTPYGIALTGNDVFITLARGNEVAELSSGSLEEINRINVPAGPQEVIAQNGRVWVHSVHAHALQAIETGKSNRLGPHLVMSNQTPQLSSNDSWIAVEGMERVTLVSAKGRLRRIPLARSTILSLLVQRNGSILVGEEGGNIVRYA